MDRDTEEALALLREAEMARRAPNQARIAATKTLFSELVALSGKYGLGIHVDEEWSQLEVQLGHEHGFVVFTERGIEVGHTGGARVLVELELDPDIGRLVGREVDTFRLPAPGDVKRRWLDSPSWCTRSYRHSRHGKGRASRGWRGAEAAHGAVPWDRGYRPTRCGLFRVRSTRDLL